MQIQLLQPVKQLDENLYHVVVMDIRMEETDPSNVEGLDLLKELRKRGLSDATKVIMLSAYGTIEYVRMAFTDYEVADFLSKDQFGGKVFVSSVRQVFANKVHINLALDIYVHARGKLDQFVLSLDIDGNPIKRGSWLHEQLTIELDDLLCRLFYEAQKVVIRPLMPGYSGTGVLRIQPFYENRGAGREVVVKFGAFKKIWQEYDNFKRYVEPFVRNGHSTAVVYKGRTPHLGGIVYSFLDTSNDQLVDFGTFYQQTDSAIVEGALDKLFHETCGAWYDNRHALQLLDLGVEYQILLGSDLQKIESRLSRYVKYKQGKRRFAIPLLDDERTFTNPLVMLSTLPLRHFAYSSTTHGDFNLHNILVNKEGSTWLIDFQETRQTHILRDIAMLDAAIRFQLLEPADATLAERLQLEEALCRLTSFSQVEQMNPCLFKTNPALEKAYTIVLHLRRLAYRLTMQHNSSDTISEYYIALLFTALNTLQFSSLSLEQREHALICASLLVDRLAAGC